MLKVTLVGWPSKRPYNQPFNFTIECTGTWKYRLNYGDGSIIQFETNCAPNVLCYTHLTKTYNSLGNFILIIEDFDNIEFNGTRKNTYANKPINIFNSTGYLDLSDIESLLNVMNQVRYKYLI